MKILRYAAAVLVPVFFVGITLKYTDYDHSSDKSVLITQPILPGAAKAILTLDLSLINICRLFQPMLPE